MASATDFPFSRFYFRVFVLVRLSESGCVWRIQIIPSTYLFLERHQEEKRGNTVNVSQKTESKSRLTKNKASLRDRWPTIVLHLVPTYCKHSMLDWLIDPFSKCHLRWSKGSKQLLYLAEQLDEHPRWLSCRTARSAFYDHEKASI